MTSATDCPWLHEPSIFAYGGYEGFSTAQLAGLRAYLRRAYDVLATAGFQVKNLKAN